MTTRIVEFHKAKDLNEFVKKLVSAGFQVEPGPHAVLEDHSELAIFTVYRESMTVAHVIAHYITQYYRAVVSDAQTDSEFLQRLIEIKYSGEQWSIPVNPLYIVVYDDTILEFLNSYEDTFPVSDAESLLNSYRERNPNYKTIPRVVVARLTGDTTE